jgi:hypothetical protein
MSLLLDNGANLTAEQDVKVDSIKLAIRNQAAERVLLLSRKNRNGQENDFTPLTVAVNKVTWTCPLFYKECNRESEASNEGW